MQYELHETVLIIKTDTGFETTVDVEYLSQVEVDKILEKLIQNQPPDDDEDADPVLNLTFPTYDLLLPDADRDITSFLQLDFTRGKVIILIQVDHPRYSTSILQSFPLNEDTRGTLVEMLTALRNETYPGTIADLYEEFVLAHESENDTDTDQSSSDDSED